MNRQKKIVLLTSRFPWPLEKGDKLRAFYMIKELSRRHEVYLFSISDKKIPEQDQLKLKPYCKEIQVIYLSGIRIIFNLLFHLLFSYKPLQVAYFYHYYVKRQWNRFFQQVQPDVVICQLIRMAEYVKETSALCILDYMDALSKGMERRYKKAGFLTRWAIKIETKRLKLYEHNVWNYFDHHLIISENDRHYIMHAENDKIKVVPNGIDFDKFCRKGEPEAYTLLFTGNMSYPPNVEAALYLARHIFPLIQKEYPQSVLYLCGADPVREIRKLKSHRIIVTGWVEDIVAYYEKSSILIAPLKLGSGLQNKILEAMAMHVPCITTPMVNAAIQARPDKEILLAEKPEEFLIQLKKLWDDAGFAQQLANNAYVFVKKYYHWEQNLQPLENIIRSYGITERKN